MSDKLDSESCRRGAGGGAQGMKFCAKRAKPSNAKFLIRLVRANFPLGCFVHVLESRPDADRRHVAELLERLAGAAEDECPAGFAAWFRSHTRPSTLQLWDGAK